MAYLMVNVDTEEEGLFGGQYPTRGWQLGHLAELPRLQAIFDRFAVRPTYQVTTPVVLDPAGSRHLQDFLSHGRCDIGGHLHPWATEPMSASRGWERTWGSSPRSCGVARPGRRTSKTPLPMSAAATTPSLMR